MTAERQVRVVAAGRLQPRPRREPEQDTQPADVVEIARPGDRKVVEVRNA